MVVTSRRQVYARELLLFWSGRVGSGRGGLEAAKARGLAVVRGTRPQRPFTHIGSSWLVHAMTRTHWWQVERSQAAAAAADVVIMVVDSAEGWTDADTEIYRCGGGSTWGGGEKGRRSTM